MQIQLEKTLDVEVVEGQLAELWKQISGDRSSADDVAVMRARVANLLVFVPEPRLLDDVRQMIVELTSIHPSRVLMMCGAREAPDRDIEMSVESYCQTDKRSGAKRLCCEEITLHAQGSFVVELPSAALPLLVSDLATFLWWRDAVQTADKVFLSLMRAADRLVIDSAEFEDTKRDLVAVDKVFKGGHARQVGISDINWARLTFWHAGVLTLTGIETEDPGNARDINFDPLVLPDGIEPSDDPLLNARSTVYAASYRARTGEPKSPPAVQVDKVTP